MLISNSSTILFFLDLAKRTRIRKYLKFYNEAMNWQRSDIEDFQFKKFKELIRHAYKNVPYYRELFDCSADCCWSCFACQVFQNYIGNQVRMVLLDIQPL